MAKRDTLYTVNRWNKPFFEEAKRRKLYLGGGNRNNITPGLGGLDIYGYNNIGGITATAPTIKPLWTLLDNADFTGYKGNYTPIQNQVRTYAALPGVDSTPSGNQDIKKPDTWLNILDDATNAIDSIVSLRNIGADLPPAPESLTQLNNLIRKNFPKTPPVNTGSLIPSASKSLYDGVTLDSLSKTLGNSAMANSLSASALAKGTTSALTSQATTDAIKASSQKLADSLMTAQHASKPNFFTTQLGQGLAMTAADLAGDAVRGWVRNPKLNNTTAARVGDIFSKVGTLAGTGLMASGYGLPVGLAVLGAGKALGMLADQFGSVYEDNGATAYTNWLRNLNTNGSDEYLAQLRASVGMGPEATATRGAFAGYGNVHKAERTNATQGNELNRFYRGIDDAFANNAWLRQQYALNDYSGAAMGGKLNRRKCNCKATGGILNNAYIDPATATGYGTLQDIINIQLTKNQNSLDVGSMGNSFMGLSNGTLFADGGGININPAHKGEFTAKAKRHGMGVQQFANHVLAHKDKFPSSTVKQAVFAKNANTWKKAFGGKLNYGKDKDNRDSGFFNDPTLYELGGTLQAAGSNWGRATEINAGGTHEESPYDGVLVGVDPEGTPNLVEEGEVIFNDYVFSNRIKCPKEICKVLRVGVKKDGFTFAEVAKKLLKESKERPNDPISKRGLDANMQKLEDAQEEVKQKMEAEEAVEQFNSLPPEQQVAIMNQEGARAQNAVAQQQMAQELQNMPPEQQQAITQQMMGQGMSPEEQYAMQQQALLDQAAQQQQYASLRINPQEALAQAAAMQQQAIAAYGGRLFAEGGELGTEEGQMPEEQYQQAQQPAELPDPEMAKYSDEELQEMINEYEEAANGEKKVTKGKLARLKKKAEKAERELERRNSQGENSEEEQSNATQGQRQEPALEETQAAAQALAQQQMMEGQSQEQMPQLGMSPEQAMMMQQQMGGGQMSPEQMAAMELQLQGNGQYAYGGRLYLTGGQLMGMFGLNTDSDIAKAGWTPEMFGISSWYDEIPQSIVDEWVTKGNFPWLTDNRQSEKWIPNNTIRMAMTRGYNPFIPQKTPDQYNWHKPPTGAQSPFFTSGSWAQYYGEEPTKDTIIDNDKYKAFIKAYPNALAGLDYSDGMTLGKIDDYMKKSPYWKLRQDWLWKHPNAKNNRLAYMANIAENNANAIDKNDAKKFSALGIYDFKKTDNGYTVTRKDNVTNDLEKQWWDAVTSDYKYGDMYNTPDGPLFRDIYIDLDTGDIMYTKPGSDWTQVGNPYQSFVAGTDANDPGYNQNIYFFKKNGAAAGNTTTDTKDESKYLTSAYTPSVDWTGVGLGIAPGLTGLGFQLARGVPDMSEIDNAVAAYERNTGTMIAPHLTHGLIRPAIIDPRVVGNRMDALRLGTNRLLMNTGSTPSRGATILANDNNYIGQIGQAMINNWKENRAQEQAAAAFNRETNTTNANILNQVDQFNAQTQAALAKDAALMRYQAAKDKIAARDAYYQGLLGNIGSIFQGGYLAWRENQRRNDRNRLAASGVFGETNGILDDWLGINKIDPDTHMVVRGPQRGKYYWINPNTGKEEYLNGQPPLSISFDTTLKYPKSKSQGGKIRKSKKRKGYTF